MASGSACPTEICLRNRLFQWQLTSLVFARTQMISLDHPGARIPAQQGIIISHRTNRFRFFKPIHRFAESFVGMMATAGGTARELSLGQTLCQNLPVIGVLIFASNFR